MNLTRLPRAFALSLTLLTATAANFSSAQELSFTAAQVESGKALYKDLCQMCHGSTLANGQFGTPLKGEFFQDKWKGKSVGELATFVFEKMPPDKPMTLTEEQYLGAVAYILSRNNVAATETVMSNDKAVLAKILLPW